MDGTKAYILGVLAGDGSIYYYSKGHVERLKISGKDKEMVRRVARGLIKIYGKRNNKGRGGLDAFSYYYDKYDEVWITGTMRSDIVSDIKKYGCYGTKTWRVPFEIKNGSPKVKASFIRGFADAEGHVNDYHIILVSVNGEGLKDISELLKDLDIKSKIYQYSNLFQLVIQGKDDLVKFAKIVGFTIKRKQQRLLSNINHYDMLRYCTSCNVICASTHCPRCGKFMKVVWEGWQLLTSEKQMSYATEEYRKVLEERRRQVEQQMQKVEFGKVEGK